MLAFGEVHKELLVTYMNIKWCRPDFIWKPEHALVVIGISMSDASSCSVMFQHGGHRRCQRQVGIICRARWMEWSVVLRLIEALVLPFFQC
jgi:hypothetical protein